MSTEEGQLSTIDVKPEEVKTEDVKTEEVKLEDVKSEDVKLEDVKSEEVKIEDVKSEEVKIEDVKIEEKKAPSEMDLLEIIKDSIDSEKKDIVSEKVKPLLLKLSIVHKKHLDNIETFFNQIMKDKKIDIKDLPVLIGLVQELFIIYDELKAKIKGSDIGAVLRAFIVLLLQYKCDLFQDLTEEQKTDILASLDTILELSTQLIELKDTRKIRWCSFLPCI